MFYDDNGNLQSEDRFDYEYSYDYRNRLVKIEDDTSTIVDYTYDALGRRIRKLIDGDARVYYYDTMGRVLAEFVSTDSNTVEYDRSFVYGNGYDETLAMYLPQYDGDANVVVLGDFCATWLLEDTDTGFDPNFDYDNNDFIDFYDFAGMASDANYSWDLSDSHEARWYYLHDGLGSVMGLVGARYARTEDREFYLYDVFGKPSGTDSAGSGNPLGFAGMRYDPESGQYHTKYRNYEPEMAIWIQPDPWGYVDGLNLYEYAGSNPINNIDPFGTDFIAVADRPVKGTIGLYHYSLQHWKCACPFRPLKYTKGFEEAEIRKKCGGNAKRIGATELLVRKDWKVWARDNNNEWKKIKVWVAEIMFKDNATKIMPVFDDNPSVVKKRWDQIIAKAKYYSWAEHRDLGFLREGGEDNIFRNWPKSLYKSWQTNSNTFVRYVAGDLMTEMSGSHPGHQTPSQNSIDGYRFSPYIVPWKNKPDPKRPGAR